MNRQLTILAACTATVMLLMSQAAAAAEGEKIRVAVAGDSLCTNSDPAWPAVLAQKLGDGYEVKVFAANGLSVLRNTYRSIWTRYELTHSLSYSPNIALVCFGANDAKDYNWKRKGEFVAEYNRIIAMYKALPTKPKIYLCLPPPAVTEAPYGISRDILHDQLIPTMKEIAKDAGVEVIDTHTPLKGRSDATGPDGLYPTKTGHEIVGLTVYSALTGKAVELPAPPKEPTKEELAKIEKEEADKAAKAVYVVQMKVGDVVELTPAYIANPKGDGADGKGNTEDDTWQFWFQYDTRNAYGRMGEYKKGPTQVPGGKDVEGWVYSDTPDGKGNPATDWSPEYEGVWGNTKKGQMMLHPYTHHGLHASLAITFRVPADGTYEITGGITDVLVVKKSPDGVAKTVETPDGRTIVYGANEPKNEDGVFWFVEVVAKGSDQKGRLLGQGKPVGDKNEKDSDTFEIKNAECKKGELVRFGIDPNKWWGTDLTRIDGFKIKRLK